MTFVIPNKSDGIHEMIKIEGSLSATRECIILVSSFMKQFPDIDFSIINHHRE